MVPLLLSAAMIAPTVRLDQNLTSGWESVRVQVISDTVPEKGWAKTALPNTTFVPAPGDRTAIWLRRTIPGGQQGRTFLQFDAAGKAATLFIDGKRADRWMDSWSPHRVEITSYLRGKASVEVALRCSDKGELYADGFLPPKGAPDSALEGKVLWPLGGYHDAIGAALPIRLLTRPQAFIADHDLKIVTSVRRGTISVEGRADGAKAGTTVKLHTTDSDGRIRELGRAVLDGKGRWSLKASFPKPRLWSPESPHLYHLTAQLDDERGRVLDVTRVRFGFREIWTEGAFFFLNGVRRNLLSTSTWPVTARIPKAEIRRRLLAVKASNAIAFRLHIGPWQSEFYEIADEIGLMLIGEAPNYTDGSGIYAYKDPRFWRNYESVIKGLIKDKINHPSLIMWSLGNETLFMGNLSRDKDLPKKMGDLARFARMVDATRLYYYSADHDPDGAYDMIGLHYPHELPNQHAYPVICDWLGTEKQTEAGGGMLGRTGSSFKWERKKPLYIGEYLWVPHGDYSPGSVYFGPQAYLNKSHYNSEARVNSWFDQTVAYRRAGVPGLSPWTAFGFGVATENVRGMAAQKSFYKPVAAFLRRKSLRFYSGTKQNLTYDVFNDSTVARQLVLDLSLDGKPAIKTALRLNPGETQPVTVQIDVPSVATKTVISLSAKLLSGGVPLDLQSADIEAYPRSDLKAPQGFHLVSIGSQAAMQGLTGKDPQKTIALIAHGLLNARKVEKAGGLPVIGGSSFDASVLKAWVERGGTAVLLEQDTLAPLGLPLQLIDHLSTMAFGDRSDWPAQSFWGSDMISAKSQLARTGKSGLRSLTTTGGPQSLAQSPISFMNYGKGRFGFVQAMAGAKAQEDPAAMHTIQYVIDRLVGTTLARQGSVAFVGEDPALWERLKAIDLDLVRAGSQAPAQPLSGVILCGNSMPSWLPKAVIENQVPVLWMVRTKEAFEAGKEALGASALHFQPGSHTTSWVDPDPLLVGATAEELTLTTPPVNWDKIIQPYAGTCTGLLVPGQPSGPAQVIPAAKFQSSDSVRQGEALLIRRKSPVKAAVESSQAGWAPIEIHAIGIKKPLVCLNVNGERSEWLAPTSPVTRTWIRLPKGKSEISLAVENAHDWSLDGVSLLMKEVRIQPTQAMPPGVRVLSGPGSISAWNVKGATVVASSLSSQAIAQNPLKAERLLAALCANAGMSFKVPASQGGDRVSLERFVVESGAYNSSRADLLEMRSTGSALAEVWAASAGSYFVTVEAESSPFQGEFSEFSVEVDGAEVGRAKCTQAGLKAYHIGPFRLSEGARSIRLRFINDASGPGEDRNLFIRHVSFVRQ